LQKWRYSSEGITKIYRRVITFYTKLLIWSFRLSSLIGLSKYSGDGKRERRTTKALINKTMTRHVRSVSFGTFLCRSVHKQLQRKITDVFLALPLRLLKLPNVNQTNVTYACPRSNSACNCSSDRATSPEKNGSSRCRVTLMCESLRKIVLKLDNNS